MHKNERDKVILKQLQEENKDALKLLFDAYYTTLCLYSVQITESLEQSEDIVQELFINLWEKKLYNNIKVGLGIYLYHAVRNQSIAFARKKLSLLDVAEFEDAAYSPFEEEANKTELIARYQSLYKVLQSLSPQEYKVLTEIVLNKKKYKEVASELSISVNTVKTHLRRAFKILRKDDSLNIFFMLFF